LVVTFRPALLLSAAKCEKRDNTRVASGAFLSLQDVERLLADPSPAARGDTAAKVATAWGKGDLTPSERQLAAAIVTALARDAELLVRETLAEHVRDNPKLPRGVALKLARDTATVAGPLLQFSPVFTDADLIELVQAVSPLHQSAIAGRSKVSPELCDALISHGAEPAVAVLIDNRGARITSGMMERALDRFPDSRRVGEALARHPQLPPKFVARLIAQVSAAMRETLVSRYQIPPAMAADTMMQLRERTLLGLVGDGAEPPALAELVADLHKRGQLTPTLVLRALAGGDLAFFEQALAQLAGISPANTRLLIYDPGKRGLAAICQRCGLPKDHQAMIEAVIELARGFDFQRGTIERAEFTEMVTGMMLADYAILWDPQEQRWLARRRSRAQTAQRLAVAAA
jgi:uncharacterized protein (DUF2336 family)